MAPPYVCKIVSLKVRNKKWALSKNCLKTCLITPMFVCLFVYLAVFVMLCVLSCLNWRLAYMAKCLADKINFRCPFIGKPFICYPLPRGIETAQSSRAWKRILNGVLLQEQTKVLILPNFDFNLSFPVDGISTRWVLKKIDESSRLYDKHMTTNVFFEIVWSLPWMTVKTWQKISKICLKLLLLISNYFVSMFFINVFWILELDKLYSCPLQWSWLDLTGEIKTILTVTLLGRTKAELGRRMPYGKL